MRRIAARPDLKRVNEKQDRSSARVAELWSRKLDEEGTDFSPDVYWLAMPEVCRRYMLGATRGRREDSWVNDCVDRLAGQTPMERMLSIGCGTGALERHLSVLSAFRECDAWDIAPAAIETARRLALEQGLQGIRYEVRDANAAEIPAGRYDAVWFNSSLHHIEALESVCEAVARSLKPGGWLFLHEYVGPSVFDFPPRQQEVIRAAFDLIPPRFRRRFGPDGFATAPAIPSPAAVAAVDPSEAVRSADILEVVGHYFDVVECNPAGGTVLQFLLHGIAGNFRPEDPESMKVLDLLIRIESTLIEVGDLRSDFVVVMARRRGTPAPSLRRPAPAAAPTRAWRAGHLYRAARRRLKSILLSFHP
jgi:SAM-dependent methyltransferase